ncbi:uncharacterized protein LOC142606009 [Castanea sativa]|uniref:uncharacterized protein LOC142606009 n=1 Tax=Castanea sativa TaxID=21020 RepID=UPI003F650E12
MGSRPTVSAYGSYVQGPVAWTTPPRDCYKVNVDGAVFKDLGHYGIAVVIRNDKGQLMGAMSKRFPFPLGALEIEAKAAECGVIFASEGDSKVVMHSVADSHPAPLSIRYVVAGTKASLFLFTSWKAVFSRRQSNSAAHLLARYANVNSDCTILARHANVIS